MDGSTPFAVGVRQWLDVQTEWRLAKAVRDLLRSNRVKAPGMCRRQMRETIEEDPALTAYFRSVAEAGDDAWREEVARLRWRHSQRQQGRRRPDGDPELFTAEPSITATMDLLPIWREWGRLVMAAERAKPSA